MRPSTNRAVLIGDDNLWHMVDPDRHDDQTWTRCALWAVRADDHQFPAHVLAADAPRCQEAGCADHWPAQLAVLGQQALDV